MTELWLALENQTFSPLAHTQGSNPIANHPWEVLKRFVLGEEWAAATPLKQPVVWLLSRSSSRKGSHWWFQSWLSNNPPRPLPPYLVTWTRTFAWPSPLWSLVGFFNVCMGVCSSPPGPALEVVLCSESHHIHPIRVDSSIAIFPLHFIPSKWQSSWVVWPADKPVISPALCASSSPHLLGAWKIDTTLGWNLFLGKLHLLVA